MQRRSLLRRASVLGVAIATLPLAGCSGDGDGNGQTDSTTSATGTATSTAPAGGDTTTGSTTAATTATPSPTTVPQSTTSSATTATTASTTATTTSTSAPTTTAAEEPPMSATVALESTSFSPRREDVAVGATVEWVNRDSYAHDVTSARFSEGAASWDYSVGLDGGGSATHTFDAAGYYEYYCTIHGEASMCGVIVVGDTTYDGSLPCAGGGGG